MDLITFRTIFEKPVEVEGAILEAGKLLGLFPADWTWDDILNGHKYIVASNCLMFDVIWHVLCHLERVNALIYDDDCRFVWNPDYDLDAVAGLNPNDRKIYYERDGGL
jgi:hypothetical protein